MEKKICKHCEIEKSTNDFYNDERKKDGLEGICKECKSLKAAIRYEEKKEQINQQQKEYYSNNKEKKLSSVRSYAEQNKDAVNEKNKKYRRENQSKLKIYRQTHKKERNDYERNKKKNDINYRISCRLRSRLSDARRNKNGSAVTELGCSLEWFIAEYIPSLWKSNMTWENYGKWHLDHIKPLTSFNLTDREQFLKASYYTNYQPLWAQENLSKGKKVG